MTLLEDRIRTMLNLECAENGSNTPDYVLARYLVSCLDAFDIAVRERDSWYGVELKPGCSTPGDGERHG